jgi:nucleoside-diphosphate-sugar epimerase/pimeloyl-ACP methyl ester carboxylesterase
MNDNKRTIFVLGAGWIGLHLARRLHLDGHKVRSTTRNANKLQALQQIGIHGFLWDCIDFDSGHSRSQELRKVAGRATHWILTIPPVRAMNQTENEQWHRDVLQAAEECGVEKLILLSSTSVYPDSGIVRERDASQDLISPHSGKCMLALEKVFDTASFAVVTLRLGALIGSDRHPGTRAYKEGWKSPLRRMNATSREDAVNACEFMLFRDDCIGVFNVVTPHHPSYNDFGKQLVSLGWPTILFESNPALNHAGLSGREVSSERILHAGFRFHTANLLEWAKHFGGRKTELSIPFFDSSIQGTLHHSDRYRTNQESASLEMVVFVHGYKGFKNWGAWSLAMDVLCDQKRNIFRFDFSLNGVSPWFPDEITEEKRWSENTYRREVEELKVVCSYWQDQGYRVCVIGHSRGGGIASIASNELQEIDKPVAACMLWASVSDFAARFPVGQRLVDWEKSDCLEVLNKRTGQTLYHPFSFYESFQIEANQLNIQRSLRNLDCPLFIAHSKDDDSVLPAEAKSLSLAAQTEVEWLGHGGHTFGSKQPWLSATVSDELLELLRLTRVFLDNLKN